MVLSFHDLLIVALAAIGLFIPPRRLGVAIVPAWLFALASTEAVAVAFGATGALVIGVVLRLVGGAFRARRAIIWPVLLAAVLTVSYRYPAIAESTPLSPGHDLVGVLTGLVVAAAVMSAPPDLPILVKTIALAGAALAAVTLAAGVFADGRLVGMGLNPNYVGGMLAMPFVAAVGLAWHARQPVWLVVAAPSAVALVQAQSRGALVGVAAGIGYLVLRNRSWRQRALIVAAAAPLPILFGTPVLEMLRGGRSAIEQDADIAFREQALRLALRVAAEHPLRGIGYARFPPYAAAAPQVGVFINTHNDYARLACEAGVSAAAIFVTLLVLAMRGRRGPDEVVLRSVVVVYATTLLFANFISSMPVSVPFWLALGCLLAEGAERLRIGPDHPWMPGSRSRGKALRP